MRAVRWLVVVALVLARPLPAQRAAFDSTLVVANDNRVAAGRMQDGVLQLRLVARPALWYPEGPRGPAIPVYAFAEEGRRQSPRIPGPLIRVAAGTEVRAVVRNMLPQPLRVFGLQDRAATSIDSVEVLSGEEREVRFRLSAPGTYHYWGRTSRDTLTYGQIEDGQLAGAIVVDSAGSRHDDRTFVVTLWAARNNPPGTPVHERRETLVFNGMAWPHSERLTYTVGDSIRWRVINATLRIHPLHLHGFYFRVDARGTALHDTAYTPEQRRLAVTERLLRGESMSITWSPHTPGNWLFHCHLVEHISGQPGPRAHSAAHQEQHGAHEMSGLILGIVVKPRPGAPVHTSAEPRRRLRLFATERARVFGDASGRSFVLQTGDREPAADSFRVPASPIVLTRGEPTAIMVINRMREPVTVHWHGIELVSYFDGVARWSGMGSRLAPAIAPGDSFEVRLTPDRAGTFIYHTHLSETTQLGAGLYGSLIIVEPGQPLDTLTDRVVLMGQAGPAELAPPNVNGEVTPRPMELRAGVTYRLRFINISPGDQKTVQLRQDTTLVRWRAVAKDGADLPAHQAIQRPARLGMGAGETWDVEFVAARAADYTLQVVTTGRALPPRIQNIQLHVRE